MTTLAFVAATVAVLWGSLALKLPEMVTKKVNRYSFTIKPLFNRPRGRLTTASSVEFTGSKMSSRRLQHAEGQRRSIIICPTSVQPGKSFELWYYES